MNVSTIRQGLRYCEHWSAVHVSNPWSVSRRTKHGLMLFTSIRRSPSTRSTDTFDKTIKDKIEQNNFIIDKYFQKQTSPSANSCWEQTRLSCLQMIEWLFSFEYESIDLGVFSLCWEYPSKDTMEWSHGQSSRKVAFKSMDEREGQSEFDGSRWWALTNEFFIGWAISISIRWTDAEEALVKPGDL